MSDIRSNGAIRDARGSRDDEASLAATRILDLDSLPGIRRNTTLAPYTTWKIGGPADYFWEPTSALLPEVIRYCWQTNTPLHFLGRGSNVLIDDKGLRGLVVCTRRALLQIGHTPDTLVAEAGVPMPTLAKYAANLDFGGYEFLIGIPGTIGAGVAINAGLTAHGRTEISDVLVGADIVAPTGDVSTLSADELKLSYRHSGVFESRAYVLRARFALREKASSDAIRKRMADHLAERKRKQPLAKATAGSTFKQPEGGKPAGWYIEQAGLKGFQIGGAKVSEKHANWIENEGTTTAVDVRNLMSHIQEVVSGKFGVWLKEEVRFLPL